MFLHLSASHFVHKGVSPSVYRHLPPPQTPPSQCMLGYTLPLLPDQCMLRYTPPCPVHAGIDMATAADGTHPTGMHSFFSLKFVHTSTTMAIFCAVAVDIVTHCSWEPFVKPIPLTSFPYILQHNNQKVFHSL